MVQDVLVPPASLTNSTPAVSNPFQANWGTSGEKFMLGAGVFLENATLYNYGKELILYSSCANLSGTILSTGQSSESGRDQQHTQLGLGNYVEAFKIMENQYDPNDFFAELDNRLMAGMEYTAKYLMGGTVPYSESFARCDANLLGGPWPEISTSGITPIRPVWEAGYAHYVVEKGLAMPYTKALVSTSRYSLAEEQLLTTSVDRGEYTRWAKSSGCHCRRSVLPNTEVSSTKFRTVRYENTSFARR